MQESDVPGGGEEPAEPLAFGLLEALLALAGAIAAALTGELLAAAVGFGLAAAVLASRLSVRSAPAPRRLGLILWTAVAIAIVLVLTDQAAAAAIVAISSVLAATLVVSRVGRDASR